MFPISASSKQEQEQQQCSNASLPQSNEGEQNTPAQTEASSLSLRGGVVRVMLFKKLLDGSFSTSDDSLDHSLPNDRNAMTAANLNNILSSGSVTASFGSNSSHQTKKNTNRNNIDRWSQNQQLNLQCHSSTRWMDNDE